MYANHGKIRKSVTRKSIVRTKEVTVKRYNKQTKIVIKRRPVIKTRYYSLTYMLTDRTFKVDLKYSPIYNNFTL